MHYFLQDGPDKAFLREELMHKLGAQYENHSYVKELTNQCNVVFIYGTYVVDDIRKLVFN